MQNLTLTFKEGLTNISVTDWAFRRFSHLQDTTLTDYNIPSKILEIDENRDWDLLNDDQKSDLIDVWLKEFPMGPIQ